MEVSVVIAAKNAEKWLPEQLEALASQKTARRWELILADNGSDDRTPDLARAFEDRLPGLRIIDASGQPGAGYARNVGAREARGQMLLFCDADDIVEEGWLDALADGLRRFDVVGGACEERVLTTPDSRAIRWPLTDNGLPVIMGFLPRAVGANLGVRADAFGAVSGFDPAVRVSEDTDLCFRLQLAGYSLGYVPDARVQYRHRRSVADNLRQAYRFAAVRPLLFQRYRGHGARRSWGVLGWAALVLRAWWLVAGRERRLRWLGMAVRRLGRVVGSIRYRTWYL